MTGTTPTAAPATTRLPVRTDQRSVFLSQLESDVRQAIDVSDRNGRLCAMLALDLGRFKAVTDILGHLSSAALLGEATRRLEATVDDQGQVVTLGGDEFVVVLPNVADAAEANALADQILDVLRQPYDSNEGPMLLRASIGIAVYPRNATDAPSLLLRANEALYWAKRRGRARACQFDPALHQDMVGRRLLERDLRAALASGSFALDWQPFVAADTQRLLGYEAFLRWDRPGHGLVPPRQVMAVAEASDLAASIDAWVLDAACQEASRWAEPLRVAVNVSPPWLKQNDVAMRAARALSESGLDAARLELDIDSRGFSDGTDLVAGEIAQLKQLGVRLALNDFGNGCSMLGQMKDLPFDKMKLNRALLVGLGTDPKVGAIVHAALQLGAALGVGVCATGVETYVQFDLLVEHGCSEVQGSLIGAPQKIAASPSAALIALHDEHYQLAAAYGITLSVVLGATIWAAIGLSALWIWTLVR